MDNKKYFLYLISCFLNSKVPSGSPDDWNKILYMANSHQMVGVISQCVTTMPKNEQPKEKLRLKFLQYLGRVIQYNEVKSNIEKQIISLLTENQIDYLVVKGSVISNLYPVKYVRISSDIDIIVKKEEFDRTVKIIKSKNYEIVADTTNTFEFKVNGYAIEIHYDADSYGKYFGDIFSQCTVEGYKYTLSQYDNLMYVVLHLVKHLASRGAGIKMLMDIDAVIRSIDDFDIDFFLSKCKEAEIEKCAMILLSLCKTWFDTPIDLDVVLTQETINTMEKVFLDGGTYGYDLFSLGGHYISKTGDENVTLKSKIKALNFLLFPPKDVIIGRFPFVKKHKILLPVGYAKRFFGAIFMRRKHSADTLSQIVSAKDTDLLEDQVRKELGIDTKM